MRSSLVILVFIIANSIYGQQLYFPPITGDDWQTITADSLNWETAEIDNLYSFLEENNTKAFIILKDGKIVLEKYFDSFDKDSIWYWASAGKSLTSFLVGLAQEDGYLSINDKSSKYLNNNWTSCSEVDEDKIKISHQLTMTTGLDDNLKNPDCTDKLCLEYLETPGERWAYHNAPYTLLDKVIENSTGQKLNIYHYNKIKKLTGMKGFYAPIGDNNVYFSNARSMARFGLLMLGNGTWDNKNIMEDKSYLNEMISPSQALNRSYGYLWWLNYEPSFMLPRLQTKFKNYLMPNAPKDMYSAIGKNGQLLNIVPSQKLIIIRMGNASSIGGGLVPTIFNNELWNKLNAISDDFTSINEGSNFEMKISPNPAQDYIIINTNSKSKNMSKINIYNALGESIYTSSASINESKQIDISFLETGAYFISFSNGKEIVYKSFIKH